MIEIWKDVPNFEKYQVSNFGNIRSLKSGEPKSIKPMKNSNGYLSACFWQNKKCNKVLIHRLVAFLFVDNPKGFKEVNHKDEDKENNCYSNLEWCDHFYNIHYGSCLEKIGCKNKGRKANEETKLKLSIDSSNKRWINNGIKESFAKKEKIDIFLTQGWKLGRLERR